MLKAQQSRTKPEPAKKIAENDDFKENLEALLARHNRGSITLEMLENFLA